MKKMREIIQVFIVVAVVSLLVFPTTTTMATTTDLIKTHLVGRRGLCLDSDGPSPYNFPKLVPCKAMEDTQLWTFPNDGTIRWSNDRCLYPEGMKVLKQYIYVKTGECDKLQVEDKTWTFNNKNGSIIHVHSSLVLTVGNNSKSVNVESNRNEPSQFWDDVDRHATPRVGYIMGLYNHQCLFFNSNYPLLRIYNCSRSNTRINQLWDVFDDLTIRANDDKSLCMTSFRQSSPYYMIGMFKCQGLAEQRWEMDSHDFTIHHPDSALVMDAVTLQMGSYHPQIITLFTHNEASTQKWTFVE